MALVKYNAKNVYSCLSVRLIPGVNEVEDSLLLRVLNEPLFKYRVDKGIIELLDKPKSSAKESKKEVKESEEKHLVSLIPDVYDVKLLKKYIEESKDNSVVKAAKKQLNKIESVEVKEEVEVGVTIK